MRPSNLDSLYCIAEQPDDMLTLRTLLFGVAIMASTGLFAQYPFNGFYVEEIDIPAPVAATIQAEAGWSNLPRCWRLHACSEEQLYEVQSFFGDASDPWILNNTEDFYQWFGGGALANAVPNPILFDTFPAGEFDSWFTIGRAVGSSATSAAGTPNPFNTFETGAGFTVNDLTGSAIFGAWVPPATEGIPDAENDILLAQFTVPSNAVISGTWNIQFRRLDVDYSIYDPDGLGPLVSETVQVLGATWSNVSASDTDPCPLLFLPVELSSFSLTPEDSRVKLNWRTDSELNADHFVIERSKDGQNFHPIGTMPAVGTTVNTTHYSSFDFQPLPGMSYYRLKTVDTNGETEISDMRHVEFKPKEAAIYPNPVVDVVNIAGIPQGVDLVRLTDARGATLKEWMVDKESAAMSPDLSAIPTGVYFLELVGSDAVFQTERVIVSPR